MGARLIESLTVDRPWLMLGDCAERLKEIPDGSVDLTVTSPPYDNLRTYNGYSFDFETIAQELCRVTKRGGVVVWVVGDATVNGSETGTSFRQALHFKEIGFYLHDTMIYEKVNPVPYHHNRYQPCFEFMFVLSRGKPKAFNPLLEATKGVNGGSKQRLPDGSSVKFNSGSDCKPTKFRRAIWKYSVGDDRSGHPAVFPAQLAADHIASWSNPGDVVLDPFLGSGTTGKMAILADRRFIGIEMSDQYLTDIATPRIMAAVQQRQQASQPAPQIDLFDIAAE